MKDVFIVSAVRTPIGSFGGVLSSFSAIDLGTIAIRGALEKINLAPEEIEEVLMGNVLSANLGQAPARQAALQAGLPVSVCCTTINKVCASGMKSIMYAAQSIMLGQADVVIAGGMESMSNVPYYIPKARFGYKYGGGTFVDGLEKDGLLDVYDQCSMGGFADATARKYDISREEQDIFTINSYKKAAEATITGAFSNEIVPISIPQKKGNTIVLSEDEEYKKVIFDKIPALKAAFTKDGTVTAASSSPMNDAAAALILMSKEKMEALGLKPLARIVSFADAEHEPAWFTTAPTLAAPKALKKAGLKTEDIDFYEVNEAFSVVPLAFTKVLNIPIEKINAFGGAVALGHPLGCSGARIVTTLLHVLQQKGGRLGLAGICNGGGGASALVVERL